MSGSVSGRVGAFCRGVILGCCLVACASPLLAQDVPEVDGGWPRYHGTASGGEVTLFAPQVAGWDGQKHMVGFCAVSYAPKGAAKSELGTVKFEAETEVSVEERLVRFVTLRLTESNFPTRSRDQIREVTAGVVACYPDTSRALALDRVLAAIDRSQIMPRNLEGLKADPPPIYFSKRPAVLVVLDGDAIWSPIQDNELKFAVNTNWDLFQQTPTNTLFLRVDGAWLTAPQLGGPWEPARDLPASFKALPDPDWKEVKANLPGEKLSLEKAPVVFTTVQPADLILLAGEPKYVPVTGTRLQWVSNTESDLFRLGENGPVYCLLAGRWFSAPDFTGPWEFAARTSQRISGGSLRNTSGRMSWHRCRAQTRPPRRYCSPRSLKPRGSIGRRSKPRRWPTQASRGSHRSRERRASRRRTPTRTSSRSATCITCASRACGSCRRPRPAPGK